MTRRMVFAVVALAFVTSASIALGAEDEKPKKRPGGDLFALVEKLDLSADQKDKIGEIKETLKAALATAKENKDREAAQKAFGAAREALMGVLTDEQKAELRKHLGEHKGEGDKKRPEKKKPADK